MIISCISCNRALQHCSATLLTSRHVVDLCRQVAVFLFKGLPVSLWRPISTDLSTLQSWLVDHAVTSPESELARTIIEQLNWGFKRNVRCRRPVKHIKLRYRVLRVNCCV